MNPTEDRFSRSKALLGAATMSRLETAHVLVVGVGGVGSWCIEALVRTGLKHLTIMDDDVVGESNLNRQCPATVRTLGAAKVEAMKARLLEINPECEVIAINGRFPEAQIDLSRFDVVVDAIDSVDCKAELILNATTAKVPLLSSMGAALRMDPAKVVSTRFEKVEGDALAKALRQRFKRLARFPSAKFTAVWSKEPPLKASVRGSLMMVTATFGMTLANEVIKLLK